MKNRKTTDIFLANAVIYNCTIVKYAVVIQSCKPSKIIKLYYTKKVHFGNVAFVFITSTTC